MPRVTEEHRAARRDQIVDAAIRCVAREGFHKTTMAHVIAESGLSAGAVYGYFKGKPELITAIASRAVGGFSHVLEDLVEAPGPVTLPAALAELLDAIDELVAASDGGFPRVAVHAWSEAARDPAVLEIVRTNVDRVHAAWVRVVERALADGTLAPVDDVPALARALVGLLPGYLLQAHVLGLVDRHTYLAGCAALLREPNEANGAVVG
jgi:AcrR family transcriptional regulator